MCKCDPSVRKPFCGKGDCQWPEQKRPGQAEGETTEVSGAPKYKILLATNYRGTAYPRHIRDSGGIVVTFPELHYWDGQDERYESETKEKFRIAEAVLKALNDQAQPGYEIVSSYTMAEIISLALSIAEAHDAMSTQINNLDSLAKAFRHDTRKDKEAHNGNEK